MQFTNYTPFAGDAWETVNSDGQWFATALARARFKLIPSDQTGAWRWQLDPEQGDLFGEDEFHRDDDIPSSVRHESDYVNFKPAGDLILNAHSYAPEGEARTAWTCGVQVHAATGECSHRLDLKVQGPKGVLLRQAVAKTPIRYENANGGILKVKHRGQEDESLTVDLHNPVGCGHYFYAGDAPRETQIRYAGNRRPAPPGFGAIHRSWKNRLDLAGTYDQRWIDEQHPLPPHDFDFRHHQAAHPALIVDGYFQAGMQIRLENLLPHHPESSFEIPEYRLLTRIQTQHEQRTVRMVLDTLLFDIDAENPEDFRVYASWRAYDRLYGEAQTAEVMLLPQSTEQIREAA